MNKNPVRDQDMTICKNVWKEKAASEFWLWDVAF